MKNLKVIIAFASGGFFLSLICGLFSHSKFLRLFLHALIWFAIFAALGVLIQVIYDKFLNTNEASFEDYGTGDGTSISNSSVDSSKAKIGTRVDVVIQDEELPAGESDNNFYVGDNRQMLNESDFSAPKHTETEKKEQKTAETETGFQKQSLSVLTGAAEETDSEEVSSASVQQHQKTVSENIAAAGDSAVKKNSETQSDVIEPVSVSESVTGKKNELDVLPDMADISFSSSEENEESEAGVSFSENTSSSTSSYGARTGSSETKGQIEIKDASLMAKAISSILSGEA